MTYMRVELYFYAPCVVLCSDAMYVVLCFSAAKPFASSSCPLPVAAGRSAGEGKGGRPDEVGGHCWLRVRNALTSKCVLRL